MRYLIYILFLCLPFASFADFFSDEEQFQIDSLNAIINSEKSQDTSLAKAYLSLSEILYISSSDTLFYLASKGVEVAEKNYYQSSIKEKNAYLKVLGGGYNNIGYYYENKGDIENALKYFHKSLMIEEYADNKYGLAAVLNNIALLYYKQGAKEKSLEYHLKSLKLREEIGDLEGVGISLGNIGYYYDMEGDLEKGLDYYFKSLEIQKSIDDKVGIAYSYNNIGYVYKIKGEFKKSLKYHKEGLKIQKQINDKRGMSFNLYNISLLYFENNDIAKAKKYALQALEIANELGMPDLISNASEVLSDVYDKENNPAKALEHLKVFMVMEDSLKNEEAQRLTAEQQAKYLYETQKLIDDSEFEKKQIKAKAEHEKQLAIEKKENFIQQIIIVAIGLGLLLVVAFLLFVFNRLKITRHQKEIIEQQKEMVEQSNKELAVKNKEITDSIKYAKRIQSAILPPKEIVESTFQESFITYIPKDIVAGDFYWIEKKDNKVLFAVADCTGHGVPGAMVSVVCNNALNRAVREHHLTKPGEILDKSKEIVIAEFAKSNENVQDGMDIAICAIEGMQLEYAGANNPLWIIRNGELIEVKPNKQPIGVYNVSEPFVTHKLQLEKGDLIYVFSDGYADQFGGEKGKKFKTNGLRKLLLSISDLDMKVQKREVESNFHNWKGDIEQLDDICIFGIKV